MIEKAIKSGLEETEQSQPPLINQKAQNILLKLPAYFTKGRVIAFSIVLLVLIVAYLGLILLSQQNSGNKNNTQVVPAESPQVFENQKPESELEKSIKNFAGRNSAKEDLRKNLSFPRVDLNLDI